MVGPWSRGCRRLTEDRADRWCFLVVTRQSTMPDAEDAGIWRMRDGSQRRGVAGNGTTRRSSPVCHLRGQEGICRELSGGGVEKGRRAPRAKAEGHFRVAVRVPGACRSAGAERRVKPSKSDCPTIGRQSARNQPRARGARVIRRDIKSKRHPARGAGAFPFVPTLPRLSFSLHYRCADASFLAQIHFFSSCRAAHRTDIS